MNGITKLNKEVQTANSVWDSWITGQKKEAIETLAESENPTAILRRIQAKSHKGLAGVSEDVAFDISLRLIKHFINKRELSWE